MPPNVLAVILNYNGGEDVVAAVRSLTALDWPADRLQIVVVDNASTDGSLEELAATFAGIRVVRSPSNVGFSANNLALDDLEGVDFVALVNPDAVVDPGWLRALVSAFDGNERMGAACPRLLLADRFVDVDVHVRDEVLLDAVTVDGSDHRAACERAWRLLPSDQSPRTDPQGCWALRSGTLTVPVPRTGTDHRLSLRMRAPRPTEVEVGGRVRRVGPDGVEVALDAGDAYDVVNNAGVELLPGAYARDRGLGVRDRALSSEPCEVFGWTGGGVLLSAAYLRDVGLFDDLFFLYSEDVDLSWRGRARGWTYRHEPSAVMWHRHAASSDERSELFRFHNERSRLLLALKHLPPILAARAVAGFVVSTGGYLRADVVRPLLSRRRPSWTAVLTRLRALGSVAAAAPGFWRSRRRAADLRTEPVESILAWMVEPDA